MIIKDLSSLHARLILTLLIALLPALGLLCHVVWEVHDIVEENAAQRTLTLSRMVAASQQQAISETHHLLTALSLNPDIRNATPGTCGSLLGKIVKQNDRFDGMTVIAPNGDVLCSAPPLDKPVNLSQRSHVQLAIQTGAFSLGNYVSGLVTKTPILPVALPVHDERGQLRVLLTAGLNVKHLSEQLRLADLPPHSVISLVDESGNILVRYPDPGQLIGRKQPEFERIRQALSGKTEARLSLTDIDGVRRLASVSTVHVSRQAAPVYLLVAIPVKAVEAPLKAFLEHITIKLSLAFLLIVAALGIGIERYVIRGIRKLSSVVQALAQGKSRPQVPLQGESAEIVELLRAFDDMAATLQKRQSELEQQKFALDQHAIVSIADSSGNIIYANQKFCDISQYAPGELIGCNHRVLNSGYHPPAFFQDMWRTISAGKVWQGEIRNVKRDGGHYWVETTIVPFLDHSGKPYQYVSIRTEITALILIQEELKQARDRLEARVQERTADLIQTNRMLAHDIAARKQIEQALQKTLESERRTAQQQIAILDALPAHIALLENDGTIAAVNQAWHEFGTINALTPARQSWLGVNYLEVCDTAQDEGRASTQAAAAGIRAVLDGREHLFSMEYACHAPEEQRWYRLLAAPIVIGETATDRSRNGAVVMHIDISERVRSVMNMQRSYDELNRVHEALKAAQTQLLQSEKMASVGQLAAGLAHEINNPIGYVHSNLDLLHEDLAGLLEMLAAYKEIENLLPADRLVALQQLRQRIDLDFLERDLSKLVQQSRDGTTRIKDIVKNLLDFSHADQGKSELADLHRELDSAITLASHGLKRKIKIVRAFGDIPRTECRPRQLGQVFVNLLANAAQSIDKQGTITVRTGSEDAGVWIEIADTGSGIRSEDLPRIFDPFFTTKEVGSGTGLGLSLSYRIVQDHHGHLTVESDVGKGTTFRIWLPLRQTREA